MKRICFIPTMLFAICLTAQTPIPFLRHIVELNETVYSIPVHYNITTKQFLEANGFAHDVQLQPGQEVAIRPMTLSEILAKADELNQPIALGPKPVSKRKAYAKASAIVEVPPLVPEERVVIDVEAVVAKMKKVQEKKPLVEEDRIVIDVAAVVAKMEREKMMINSVEPKKSARQLAANQDTAPNEITYVKSSDGYHLVERKQTLYRIALTYGLTVDELKTLNSMNTTDIMVGQKLKVVREQAQL